MRVLWIRHAQMDLRPAGAIDRRTIDRLFNQEDERGLSALGQRQAALVAERLRAERVDAIYASHFMRARETAEVVARAIAADVRVHEGIGELRTGYLREDTRGARFVERVTASRLSPRAKFALLAPVLVPLYYYAWRSERTIGGESPAELDARTGAFLSYLRDQHPAGARIAVVSHGYFIFTFASSISRSIADRLRVLRRPYIANGAITEVELDARGARLVRFADDAHLR